MVKNDQYFMGEALALAAECARSKNRAPFGAVVVKDGEIVGQGMEATLANSDSTAHSEIMAIRDACQQLKTARLEGCVLYTSCEPCSMCLAAIYWSGISKVYYACPREDAIQFGFGDFFNIQELIKGEHLKSVDFENYMKDDAIAIFQHWSDLKM